MVEHRHRHDDRRRAGWDTSTDRDTDADTAPDPTAHTDPDTPADRQHRAAPVDRARADAYTDDRPDTASHGGAASSHPVPAPPASAHGYARRWCHPGRPGRHTVGRAESATVVECQP